VSRYESLPSYQASALGSNVAYGRVVPDVSMDADPSTGVSVFSSVAGLGQTGWFKVGGTSAGAPIWSGLVASADQARAAAGKSTLSSTQTLDLLYSLYGTNGKTASSYATAFHDVAGGANFAGYATTGYDAVTGLGTPIASTIVWAAANYSTTTTTATTQTHTVFRLVHVRVVRRHDEVESTSDSSTTDSANDATSSDVSTVTTIVASTSDVAALPATAGATSSTTAQVVAAVVSIAPARALPNQAAITAPMVETTPAPVNQAALTVYNGSEAAPIAAPEFDANPGRGDFPSPPILDPTTPIEIWDEALASVRDQADDDLEEPQAFAPWTALDPAEDDFTEAAPSLLGAAGAAAVFWLAWSRRAEDDEKRPPSVELYIPSDN
jgi:hypothetical protein